MTSWRAKQDVAYQPRFVTLIRRVASRTLPVVTASVLYNKTIKQLEVRHFLRRQSTLWRIDPSDEKL
jgi:hypothetical protein